MLSCAQAGKPCGTGYVLARVVKNSKTRMFEPPTLVVEETLEVESFVPTRLGDALRDSPGTLCYLPATRAISMETSFGSRATSTVALAGGFSGK